jgi:hypothetical protein
MQQRFLRRLLGCLVVLVPLLAAPGARAAGGHSNGGPVLAMAAHTSCQSQAIEHPFATWGDNADYFLIREGAVDLAADWDFFNGDVVEENSSYTTHSDNVASVSVTSGQSATTPDVCVTIDDPTMRFFVKNTGAATGMLHVDVLYQDKHGNQQSLEIGQLGAATPSSWGPSPIIVLTAPLIDLLGSGYTPVEFRFRADGAGSAWLIDDVYVDPYGKG